MKITLSLAVLCILALPGFADDKPRVFITDSTSWEVSGGLGGSADVFGGSQAGGARPQTAEIIKTFVERCPDVMVNNKQDMADYVVVLDHEGGKSALQHKNKIAVFNHVNGDLVVSKSTFSLGGSVQTACEAITGHWREHAAEMRIAEEAAQVKASSTAALANSAAATTAGAVAKNPGGAHVSITSLPDSSDIEIDGNFVGNTPSAIELASGEHTVMIKKTGYKDWERKIKITGGDIKLNAELEKVQQAEK